MPSGDYREKALKEYPEECDVCGTGESIVVHHINGNRSDNRLENLVPLCRKCHMEIHSGNSENPDMKRYTDQLPTEALAHVDAKMDWGEPECSHPIKFHGEIDQNWNIRVPTHVRNMIGRESYKHHVKVEVEIIKSGDKVLDDD